MSMECVRRVDGRLVRWVLNKTDAPICMVIKKTCPIIYNRGCSPHNGFYEECRSTDERASKSYDVSRIDIDALFAAS